MTSSTSGAAGREHASNIPPDPLLANDSGVTISPWVQRPGEGSARSEKQRPPLSGDVQCDVCVVGAGVAGLTTAYRLAKTGKRVVVLDDGPLAGGESSRTTAFLNKYPDNGLADISQKHSEDTSRKVVQSFTDAIDFIEQLCRDEKIDHTFVRQPSYLFVAPESARQQDYLEKEMQIAQRIGFPAIQFVPKAPIPGRDTGRAIRIDNEACVHAARYLSGLAAACERHGATICCNTRVTDVTGGETAEVKTQPGHTVRCGWVVVCTNASIMFPVPELALVDSREAPYRTYAIALEIANADVVDAQFEDTNDPYHYVRPQTLYNDRGEERILMVGGEDVAVGREGSDDPARFDRLEQWARAHWPGVGRRRFAWSGQVFEPSDGLPFIGKTPGEHENVLIITGDSGQGFMNGTVGAMICADRVLGGERDYADIYAPSRLSPKAAGATIKDMAKAAAQYRDYVTPGDVSEESQIAPGSGAVMRKGVSKIAVYRDESGAFHRCSAVCTHAGGIVRWNAMEKTWDCPVHGSRFDPKDGRCVTSPANGGLPPAE